MHHTLVTSLEILAFAPNLLALQGKSELFLILLIHNGLVLHPKVSFLFAIDQYHLVFRNKYLLASEKEIGTYKISMVRYDINSSLTVRYL